MWQLSQTAQEALAGDHQVAIQVQVFNGGTLLEDITGRVTAGSVVEDETAAVRRTCTLTINDLSLVPQSPTDLLHPLSGNEIHVSRGVTYRTGTPTYITESTSDFDSGVSWDEGTDYDDTSSTVRVAVFDTVTELAPLGVFRMSKPSVSDDGTTVAISVTGNDRSAEIAARKWTGPYTAAAGQTVGAAIKGILNFVWGSTLPALTFNLSPSTVTVPAGTVLGVQFTSTGVQAQTGSTSGGNNPWQDCTNLAAAAGCELFFDRQGTVVMRPVPEPGTFPATVVFAEGVNCTMTQLQRTFDESKAGNQVILIGTGTTVTNPDGSTSPGAPVVATASSTDPTVGVDGPLGVRPVFLVDETVSTAAEAQAAADAQLPLVLATLDETALQATENPGLDAGDAAVVIRSRLHVSATYIMSAVTHPLDVKTAMSVTNRSFAVSGTVASTLTYGKA